MDLNQVESTSSSNPTAAREFGSVNSKKMKFQVNEGEEKAEAMGNFEEENPLGLSLENLKLAQKALAIDLILIKILENLPTKSLLKFRRVNKTWEKESTNIIMKGLKTRLEFWLDWPFSVTNMRRQNLRDLNDCIRKSRGFPCSCFDFDNVPFENADLTEFFTLHGSQVKRLEFHFDKKQLSNLAHLLLHQVPHVQELKIKGYKEMEKNNNSTHFLVFPENALLPHLKSFIYYGFPLASEIIRVSPNLKQVLLQDSSLNGVETLVSMNKIHLLKYVSLDNDLKHVDRLEVLAGGNPKIQELNLYPKVENSDSELAQVGKRRFGNALSKILDCSRTTITSMSLLVHNAIFKGVKWPRLENVSKLHMSAYTENINIPANFLSHVFPNIRELSISGVSIPSFLNSEIPLTHLEEFQSYPCEIRDLEKLSFLAPNLRKLKLSYLEESHEISNSVWAFSKLKQLILLISTDDHLFPQLDVLFTGLSEDMVRKLHEDPNYFNGMKMNKKELPRIQPSILNCPDLNELNIWIMGEPHDPPLMTCVSGEFGFKMLENLHVEIEAPFGDVFRSLGSLKPYARLFRHYAY